MSAPDVLIPPGLTGELRGLQKELSEAAGAVIDRLEDLGLPPADANHVVVDWLLRAACATGMATAMLLENRAPDRDLWTTGTSAVFDEVFEIMSRREFPGAENPGRRN